MLSDKDSPPRKLVIVAVIDEADRGCESTECDKSAELTVTIHGGTSEPSKPWVYCVEPWGPVRSLLIGRAYRITYTEGAPQLIIDRLTREREQG
jgi:hypothetical protein